MSDPVLGTYGWIRTPDGVFIACQPSGAHTWFPSNDHPSDKATFDFEITVPQGRSSPTASRRRRPRGRAGRRPCPAHRRAAPARTAPASNRSPHRHEEARHDDVEVARQEPHGHLPGDRQRGPFRGAVEQDGERDPEHHRGRPDAVRREPRPVPQAERRHHRGVDEAVRPLPVLLHRRADRQRRRRLRAGDADPPGVRGVRAAADHRRARAGAPVVRRQRQPHPLAGHLAERGLRHLRRVAVGREDRRPDRPGALRRGVRGLGPTSCGTSRPATRDASRCSAARCTTGAA